MSMEEMTTLPDQKTRIFAWLDALRSGEWKQTTSGDLHRNNGHCCLGVGSVIAGCPQDDGEYLAIKDRYGLKSIWGMYANGYGGDLTHHNDNGTTFPEIADIIEKNARTLFINGAEVEGWIAARNAPPAALSL
jgi:hypothetical protein